VRKNRREKEETSAGLTSIIGETNFENTYLLIDEEKKLPGAFKPLGTHVTFLTIVQFSTNT